MKIFIIGFNKCGTRSLSNFFRDNNIPSVHWDKGRMAQKMLWNHRLGLPLLTGYEQFQCFSDMEFIDSVNNKFIAGYKRFRELSHQYPNSKFILNTRPMNNWIKSRLNHNNRAYAKKFMRIYGIKSRAKLLELWKRDWVSHHKNVLDFFEGQRNFILFDIENDNPIKLVDFLENVDLDPSKFGHYGKTKKK